MNSPDNRLRRLRKIRREPYGWGFGIYAVEGSVPYAAGRRSATGRTAASASVSKHQFQGQLRRARAADLVERVEAAGLSWTGG
jgi:hypothetical protein